MTCPNCSRMRDALVKKRLRAFLRADERLLGWTRWWLSLVPSGPGGGLLCIPIADARRAAAGKPAPKVKP